jgi:uncharacterized protein YciI
MLAAIHCLDDPAKPGLRNLNYPEHLDYLNSQTVVHLVTTGPLFAPDKETRIGSLLIVQADDLDQVHAFSERDPFRRNGVFSEVRIHPFQIAFSNPVQSE